MLANIPLLSLLIWLPMVGAGLILMTGGDKNANKARYIAMTISLVSLALCVPLYMGFNVNTAHMQFVEKVTWIPIYGVNYYLGVDGISMPLVILTTLTTVIVIMASWNSIHEKVAQYMAAFMVMQGMMVGVFSALDAMLFYVFWEAMLIPVYLSIGVWGSANRSYASIKFFIFTFAGSAMFLIALLYLRIHTGSFSLLEYFQYKMPLHTQILIFVAFLLAFAVKIPMWPLHTWLPDAHTEAPAGGSVVLAALMLKMGAYGFLRFSLPIVPDACQALYWPMIILSLVAIIYIGFIAIVQTDMKRLIAYSSISHMGFVTLGCFMVFEIVAHSFNHKDAFMSMEGAMVQMISHAFSTGAMFVAIGIMYDKLHSRLIKDYGGVANKMPVFAALFMIFAMANVGLPGTSGFVGEFMVILSSFKVSFWVTFGAATTLLLGAAYTLWMYKRVFFGAVGNAGVESLTDIKGLDKAALFILAFCVIFLGIYPEFLLNIFHASVGHLLDLSLRSKLPV